MKIISIAYNNFHSTSFNYDARETEIIRGVEVLHLQTYVSLETVGKNSAVFVAHLSKVLWYIHIDEIPEFLSRKHDIFTTRGERSPYLFARADKKWHHGNPLLQNAGFTFHEGLSVILGTSSLIQP